MVHLEKLQFVPITALESDAPTAHREEAAASETQRIAPFECSDLSRLVNGFDDAGHLGEGELPFEHGADVFAPLDRRLRDLMVDRVGVIKRGETGDVARIEAIDPGLDNLLGVIATISPCQANGNALPRRRCEPRYFLQWRVSFIAFGSNPPARLGISGFSEFHLAAGS